MIPTVGLLASIGVVLLMAQGKLAVPMARNASSAMDAVLRKLHQVEIPATSMSAVLVVVQGK